MKKTPKPEWLALLGAWKDQARYLASNKTLTAEHREQCRTEARLFDEIIRFLEVSA